MLSRCTITVHKLYLGNNIIYHSLRFRVHLFYLIANLASVMHAMTLPQRNDLPVKPNSASVTLIFL